MKTLQKEKYREYTGSWVIRDITYMESDVNDLIRLYNGLLDEYPVDVEHADELLEEIKSIDKEYKEFFSSLDWD